MSKPIARSASGGVMSNIRKTKNVYPGFRATLFLTALTVAGSMSCNAQDGSPSITFKPFVDFETGYDSNLDGSVRNRQGSVFAKGEAGFSLKARTDTRLFSTFIKGRRYKYEALDISNRWDFEAALGMRAYLGNNQTLKIGASFYRDQIALSTADLFDGFVDYKFRTDDISLRFKAKSHTEINTADSDPGGVTNINIFNITRNSAFDYHRPEATLSVLTFKRSIIQPFFIGGAYYSDYFREVSNPVLTRVAAGLYVIGGARLKIGDNFRVDLGFRHNYRDTEDKLITEARRSFFDGRLKWTPTDRLKITAFVERKFRESTSLFGVVDDVRSYGIGAHLRLTDKIYTKFSGKIEQKDPFGDDLLYTKYVAKGSVTYKLNKKIELYSDWLYKRVEEDFFDESYNRYRGSAGVRVVF